MTYIPARFSCDNCGVIIGADLNDSAWVVKRGGGTASILHFDSIHCLDNWVRLRGVLAAEVLDEEVGEFDRPDR